MFAWHCDRLATLSRLVSVLNWKVPYQLSVVAVTPGVTVAIVKVSLWSRGKVGRTVRVLGGRRGRRGRSPVHPDWGGGLQVLLQRSLTVSRAVLTQRRPELQRTRCQGGELRGSRANPFRWNPLTREGGLGLMGD